jgi:hypothetical protein
MSILEDFLENPYIAGPVTLVGFLWTVYEIWSHIFNSKRLGFTTACTAYEIIRQGKQFLDSVTIKCNDFHVDNLTVTVLTIWNSGNGVINSTDIVKDQPLRIINQNNAEILSVEIIGCAESSNQFAFSNDCSSDGIIIHFDYVDVREGIVVQIIHTGDRKSFDVDCKIKGGAKMKYYQSKSIKESYESEEKRVRINKFITSVSMWIIVLLTMVLGLVECLYFVQQSIYFMSVILAGVNILLVISIIINIDQRYSLRIPLKLRTVRNKINN